MPRHRSKPSASSRIRLNGCELATVPLDSLRQFAFALELLAAHDPAMRSATDPSQCEASGRLWIMKAREGQVLAHVDPWTGRVDIPVASDNPVTDARSSNVAAASRPMRHRDTLGALFAPSPADRID